MAQIVRTSSVLNVVASMMNEEAFMEDHYRNNGLRESNEAVAAECRALSTEHAHKLMLLGELQARIAAL